MTQYFFNEVLQNADNRIVTANMSARLLLDKNEQPDDVDFHLKNKVLNSLIAENWNRYPTADCQDVEALVADYCRLSPENIVLSPGSANLITTLLNYFALNQKRIVIAQPSYSLFDYHCKTFNIKYEPWHLNSELEYDFENMSELGPGSVLIVTTPNNPVGNTMEAGKLEQILSSNPDTYIIVDAVYAEFCEADYSPLIQKYPNLIVLRSFSKAFPIAGLRLGYLCAAPQTASIVKKLMLQFSINQFSLAFARTMLFNPEFMERSQKRVKEIIGERDKMYKLVNEQFDSRTLKVFKSAGNFLLMRVFDDSAFQKLMADLEMAGIKVLNTSPFPLLQNTFRVSIGSGEENDSFVKCLSDSLGVKMLHLRRNVQLTDCHYQVERFTQLARVASA
ncbi:MAG: pyridoxal phosphate-dependent aminotransferase [Saprospiraceae bacterium]